MKQISATLNLPNLRPLLSLFFLVTVWSVDDSEDRQLMGGLPAMLNNLDVSVLVIINVFAI